MFTVLIAVVRWRYMDGFTVEDVKWPLDQMQAKASAKRRYVSLILAYRHIY